MLPGQLRGQQLLVCGPARQVWDLREKGPSYQIVWGHVTWTAAGSTAAGVRASSPGMRFESIGTRLPGSLGSCYLDSCGDSSCWGEGQLARYEAEITATR
jgi:hypothetical protein